MICMLVKLRFVNVNTLESMTPDDILFLMKICRDSDCWRFDKLKVIKPDLGIEDNFTTKHIQ